MVGTVLSSVKNFALRRSKNARFKAFGSTDPLVILTDSKGEQDLRVPKTT